MRGLVAFVRGEYGESLDWSRRQVSNAGRLGDPDAEAYVYESAVSPAVACGKFEEARAYAVRHDEVTQPLSAHHRLHGVSHVLLLEEMLGNWSAAIGLQDRVEAAVIVSVATPCVLNARSLLVCALARAYRADDGEARRLEREAAKYAMAGYGTVLDTPRLQLALHRGDLAAVESLLGEPAVRASNWFYLSSMAAHLDGLAALGEVARVEAEAARVLRRGRISSRSRSGRSGSCAATTSSCAGGGTVRSAWPRVARSAHPRLGLVLPVVGQELDVVEPRLGSGDGDEDGVLLAGRPERPRRLRSDAHRCPGLDVDDVALEPARARPEMRK